MNTDKILKEVINLETSHYRELRAMIAIDILTRLYSTVKDSDKSAKEIREFLYSAIGDGIDALYESLGNNND